MNGDHTDIIILQSPYIGVFPFIKVHKLTGQPEIFSSIRVIALNEILLVFGIRLAADLKAFDEFGLYGRMTGCFLGFFLEGISGTKMNIF